MRSLSWEFSEVCEKLCIFGAMKKNTLMILILTDKNDSHANYLVKKIAEQGLPYYRFCVDVESLKNTTASYRNGVWKIIQNNAYLNLKNIKCVWHRRTFVELLLEEEYDPSPDFKLWKNEWNKTLLGIYSSIRNLPWLNPWREAYKAENKYLQMELAVNHGLRVPDTLISNDKTELLSFFERHSHAALKLMHQDFYKDETGNFKGLYVNKITVDALDQFKPLEENPIVLQEYLEKDFEVRYTVVGKDHFVCKIDSQKSSKANIDWRRYDIPHTPHITIIPPNEIKMSVEKIMRNLSIEYGALDFIVTPNGEWIFLEVNSMGQFLWIEDLTGLKISDAIIAWMKNKLSVSLNS
jgi:glutathione synthase/RimK-type ligase-like ATP-grasp enzyme